MIEKGIFATIKKNAPLLSVGVLSANLMHLESELSLLEHLSIKMLHFDVMDGCFVPYLTVGPRFINAVKTHLIKDVHLMIQRPENTIEQYIDAGADMLTIHLESTHSAESLLKKLGELENVNNPQKGIIRGVALNPDTPLMLLEPLLENIEMVTVLAVDLKREGFPFFKSIGDRFIEVKKMIAEREKEIILCIDGGVKRENIGELAQLGPDILVSGSAVFKDGKVSENINAMLQELKH